MQTFNSFSVKYIYPPDAPASLGVVPEPQGQDEAPDKAARRGWGEDGRWGLPGGPRVIPPPRPGPWELRHRALGQEAGERRLPQAQNPTPGHAHSRGRSRSRCVAAVRGARESSGPRFGRVPLLQHRQAPGQSQGARSRDPQHCSQIQTGAAAGRHRERLTHPSPLRPV